MPKRIQLRRTKGWRKPPSAVVVARPSGWGNPFTIKDAIEAGYENPRRACVSHYRAWIEGSHEYEEVINGLDRRTVNEELRHLRGKDLACWCRLDQECHADVLLELASGTGQ